MVFVKAPQVGAVKRRLASEIGSAEAWRFYRSNVRRMLLRLGRDAHWRCWLAVTPDDCAGFTRSLPGRFNVIRQGRGDIGARMRHAFGALPPGPAVLVGGDIPALGAKHIARAFTALEAADAVFGPAKDGGYWLVGFSRRRACPDPFTGVAWSSPQALAETRANLPSWFRVATVDELADVDNLQDYEQWRAHQRAFGGVA